MTQQRQPVRMVFAGHDFARAFTAALDEGVAAAKLAFTDGVGPVVLAGHSERSGYANWLLRAVIKQGLPRVLIGTVADAEAVS